MAMILAMIPWLVTDACSLFVLRKSSEKATRRPREELAGPNLHQAAVQGMRALSDNVGRDLVFDKGDAVAQQKLALLHALQSQEIRCGRLMQRIDRRIEIAMLLLQSGELGLEFALIFVGHGTR
jgi:hypothetical protein